MSIVIAKLGLPGKAVIDRNQTQPFRGLRYQEVGQRAALELMV